ncbi:hypothetical protein MCERE19_04373 [Spirosomataceae bacterium]
MRHFTYISTTTRTSQIVTSNISEILFFNNIKAKTPQWAWAWSVFLSFVLLTITTNLRAQICPNGQAVYSQYATASSGGWAFPELGSLAPDNAGITVYDVGATYQGIFTYADTFSGGTSINITGRYIDSRIDGILVAFSTDGTTWTANSALIGGFGSPSAANHTTVSYTIPTSLTGAYKFIRVRGNSINTNMSIDAIQTSETECLAFNAATFFDNGDGGGTKNNCTKDGTESIGSPTGLFMNVLQGSTVVKSFPVTNGQAAISGLADGTYTMVITNSPTASVSVLTPEYSSDSPTKTVVISSGVLSSPALPILFCLQILDTDDDGVPDWTDLDDDNDGILDRVEGCAPSVPPTNSLPRTEFAVPTGWSIVSSSPDISEVSYHVYGAWNIGGCIGDAPAAPNGHTRFVSFSSNTSEAFKTTVTGLVPGQQYTFTYYAAKFSLGIGLAQHTLSMGGTVINRFTPTVGCGWETQVVLFTPTQSSEDFTFRATSNSVIRFATVSVSADAITKLVCDTDNDGIANSLDIDADGDGCSDAIEGGAAFLSADVTGTGALSGSVSSAAPTLGVPAIAGTGQAIGTSQNGAVNVCIDLDTDTDTDGVLDIHDIDDDNDGVLDATESPSCFTTPNEWNTASKSLNVRVTSDLTTLAPNTDFGLLTDGNGTTVGAVQFVTATAQAQLNKELLKIELLKPTRLDAIYIQKTTATQIFAATASSLMLQGSNDNTAWTNLLTAPIASPANATNITVNGAVSLTNSNIFTVATNAAAYKYYRIFGVAAANILAGIASEVYFDVNNATYQASFFPKATCTNDTDTDGISNHLDLDADGDGCSDAIEAGSSTTATSTTVYTTGTDTNGNGLLNSYEGTTAGTVSYSSTYSEYALSSVLNGCSDTDFDGVLDIHDIDDDNDGVLDATESPSCFTTPNEWNTASKSLNVRVTSDLTTLSPNTDFGLLTDGNGTTAGAVQFVTATAQAQLNKELLKIELLKPTRLDAIYIQKTTATQIFAATASSLMLQGSNDNTAWTNLLTAPIASPANATNITVNGAVSLTNSNIFTVATNAAAYKYYRIFGVAAANILAGIASEVYFDVNNATYQASLFPKATCTNDTDSDGKSNHLDLDADGDGCSDAIEAGSSATATSTTAYLTGADTNGNGLLNSYESATLGVTNYSSTYNNFALSAAVNACADTDGDGVKDIIDLDDDNDGVLDGVESQECFYKPKELSKPIEVSSELTQHATFVITNSIDENATTGSAFLNNVNWINKDIFRLTAIQPIKISGVSLDLFSWSLSSTTANTFKLQGSLDNVVWSDLSAAVASTASTGTFVVNNTLQPATAYTYYRLIGVAGVSNYGGVYEIYFNFPSDFNSSAFPKSICINDTDNDGKLNHIDLDSDGDGCSDAVEAGSSTMDTSTTAYPTGTDTNANGILNNYEGATAGTVNYESTYSFAVDSLLNACLDLDGDGVKDIWDIDIDNDGVLNATESPSCFYKEFEIIKPIAVSSELTQYLTFVVGNSIDGSQSTKSGFNANQNWVGKEIFRFTAAGYMAIKSLTLDMVDSWSMAAAVTSTFKLQGSGDGTTWTDLMAPMGSTLEAGPLVLTNSLAPTRKFKFFRIIGVSGISGYVGVANAYFSFSSPPSTSFFIKPTCVSDTDNDGILNYMDLDSDGDGCTDAKEANVNGTLNSAAVQNGANGSVTSTTTISNAIANGPYGANGLANGVENPVESGIISYTSAYNAIALNEAISGCLDTDSDGVVDLYDLDDDNDGIVDTEEMIACGTTTLITPLSATSSPVYANGAVAGKTIDGSGFVGVGLSALATAPGLLADSWLLLEPLTSGFIEYTMPNNSNVGAIVLWAPDAFNYGGGDAPIKDFTVEVTHGNGQVFTSHLFTTAQPTGSGSLPGAQVFKLPVEFANVSKIRLNISAGWYDVNENNTNFISTEGVTVSVAYNMFLGEFRALCSAVDQDTDNDGIVNRLDLDSDGDGCSDAIEAGSSANASSTTVFPSGTDSNGNGLLNTYESATLGVTNYSSTYNNFALSAAVNACADTDGDGVKDIMDLDDDNDGVLDAEESPSCFYVSNELSKPVSVSSDLAPYSTFALANSIDQNVTTASAFMPNLNWVNKDIFKLTAVLPIKISGVSLVLFNWALSNTAANTFKLQGSLDNVVWSDLSAAVASTATTGTLVVNNTLQPATAYTYYRLVGVAGISWYGGVYEISFNLPTDFNNSAYPKSICTNDTDTDGKLNHIDLDSDGDGCSDTIEAGSSATATSTTAYLTGADTNGNGLLNSYESASPGVTNYSSTYNDFALSAAINACTDTDGDGIQDIIDLDDDNDGILDAVESNCQYGIVVNKTGVIISKPATINYTFNGNTLSNLIDNVDANVYVIATPTGALSNSPWLNFEFPTAKVLTYLEIGHYSGQTLFSTTSTYKIQGSSDNSNWVDVTGTLTYNNVATSTSGGLSSNNSNIANFPSNTKAYKYYRIFGLTASVGAGWATEIYFKENICTVIDTDNDGIPNLLDLDSDGDGCPDAIEGGAYFSTANLTPTMALSGSVSSLAATLGVPTIAGTGQTIGSSQNAGVKDACTDTDSDGIPNVDDLDDDNDGILDAVEAPSCYFTDSEANVIASISTGLTIATGTTPLLYNGVLTTATPNFAFTAAQALANANILTVTYPTPVNLTSMTVVNITSLGTGATARLQGSVDGTSWVDLTSAAVSMSTTTNKVFTVNQNAGEYQFYRIFGVATATSLANPIFEITSVLNAAYNQSSHPKATCTVDTDNDGISNNLDLDSDGDGCSDAIEGGAAITAANLTPTTALSGSVSSAVATLGIPTIAGTGQAIGSSQNGGVSACTDSDTDGISDLSDLDDDNDGILDAVEAPSCYYTDSEANVIASISTGLTISTGTTPLLYDGVLTTATPNFVFTATQALANANIFTVTYPTPVNLASLTIVNSTSLGTGATARLQGSVDGTNWVDLTSAAVSMSTTTNKVFTVNQNAGEYQRYRIFGVATATSLANSIFEITGILNASYEQSAHPKATCAVDTDNDGIPNNLDLDSDGDGCPDAIEGGAAFTAANLSSTTALSGSVSSVTATLGVPTIAATGQNIGSSQNAAVNICTDTDTDGIPDVNDLDGDLDDDNDGITDCLEGISIPLDLTGGASISNRDLEASGYIKYTATQPITTGQFSIPFGNTAGNFGTSVRLGVGNQTSYNLAFTKPLTLIVKNGTASVGGSVTSNEYFEFSAGGTPITVANPAGELSLWNGSAWVAMPANYSASVIRWKSIPGSIVPGTGSFSFTINNASEFRLDQINESATNDNGATFNFATTCADIDTDADGIPNRLDLDSDGDGCSDAIEGGASFTSSNTTATGALSGSVSSAAATLGLPTIAGTGQSIGYSQNGTLNFCTDTDSDGIPDIDDLDDDNDGIMDTDECIQTNALSNGTFDTNSSNWVNSGNWIWFSPGYLKNDLNFTNNDELSQSFAKPIFLPTSTTTKISFDVNANNFDLINGVHTGTLFVVVNNVVYATINNPTGSNTTATVTPSNGATVNRTTFEVTTQYVPSIRIEVNVPNSIFNNTNTFAFRKTDTGDDFSIDNVFITNYDCDTDGDGIPNSRDLDSDGDGCPDAIEGGANFTTANTTATGALSGSVSSAAATLGVPTIAGTGQTIGSSQNGAVNACTDTDSDGVPDVDDLDDDNDGILDTEESSCQGGIVVNKTGVLVSTPATIDYSFNNTTLSNLLDGFDNNIVVIGGPTGTLSNSPWLNFEFPFARILTYLEIGHNGGADLFSTTSTYKIQGSKDNSTWVDVTGTLTYNNVATSISGGLSTFNSNIANFPSNTNAYKYYRIYGITASRGSGWATEVYFKESVCTTDIDTDNDGIPNRLDLDSDGDGCSDAIEGGASFTSASTKATGALSASVSSATATLGVPTSAGTGQSIGSSQNGAVKDAACLTCPNITNTNGNNTNPTTCSGSEGSIKLCGLTANGTGYTINYDKNGTPQTALTNQTADSSGCITLTDLTAGSYTNIKISNMDCLSGSNALSATLTDPTAPAAPTSLAGVPSSNICIGTSVALSATATAGATYTWTVSPTGATLDSVAGTVSGTIASNNFNSTAAGTYTVSLTQTVSGCTSAPATIILTVNATPSTVVPTAISTSNLCPAATVDLTAVEPTAVSGVTYEWHTAASNPTAGTLVATPNAVAAGTYYLYGKSSSGCYSAASSAVTATVATCCPTITNLVVNNTNPTTCSGSEGSIKLCGLTANGTGYTINYDKNGTPQTALTNQTADASGCITLTGLTAGSYTNIKISSTDCPSGSNALSANLTDPAAPAAPTSLAGVPSSNICIGTSVALSATATAGATYTWTVSPTGATLDSAAGTVSATIASNNFNSTAAGTYTVSLTQTVSGCTSAPATIILTVNATPSTVVPTAISTSNLCPAATVDLTTLEPTAVSGVTYEWHTAASNPTAGTLVATPSAVAAGTYYLYGKSSSGCYSDASSAVTATVATCCEAITNTTGDNVNPNACSTATGSIKLCGLTANGTGYTINYDKNGTPQTALTNQTADASGCITLTGLTAGSYTNIKISSTDCPSGSNALSANLTDPAAPAAPTGLAGVPSSNICIGTSVALSATGTAGATYAWTVDSTGATLESAAGTVSATIASNNFNSTAAGTYTVSLTQTVSGCTSAPATIILTVNATPSTIVPTAIITSNLCPAATVDLTAVEPIAVSGVTYEWHTAASNPTAGTLVATPSAVAAGTYYLYGKSSSGCYSAASSAVTATVATCCEAITNTTGDNVNPNACSTATGSIKLCGLTANGTGYTINYDKNGTPQTALMNQTADASGCITLTGLTAGSYTNIKISSTDCPSGSNALSANLTDPAAPTAPTGLAGVPSSNICIGTSVALSATGTAGATYSWTVSPTGATLDSTAGTVSGTTVSNTFNSTAAGTYTVSLTQTVSGCTSAPATTILTVNATPSTVVPTAISTSNLCPAATVDLTAVEPIAVSGVTYEWHTAASNPTAGTLVATPSAVAAGTYYLYGKSSSGCYSAASSAVTATVATCCEAITNTTGDNVNPNACSTATGSIKLCGLTANGTGYTINYDKNGTPQTALTNQTADASGCITLTGLTAGSYTNIKISSTDCPSGSNALSANLTDPAAPAAPTGLAGVPSSNICIGTSVALSATGTAGATYTWTVSPTGATLDSTAGTVSGTTVSNNFNSTAAGTYTVSLTQTVSGCTSAPATTILTVNATPSTVVPTAISTSNLCPAATVDLTAVEPIAVSGVTYEWHTAASNPTAGTLVATPNAVAAGTYYLYGKSSSGCYSAASSAVTATVAICLDTDGDGIPNIVDLDDDNDGILDTVENAAACGTSIAATGSNADCDGDGTPNSLDLDSDNDGIKDLIEAGGSDPDGDGIVGTGIPAVNAQGVPTAANGGAGLTPVNTDGTNGADPYDTDSDGDGILDSVEGIIDTDGDGKPNYQDTDSDNDGNPDNSDPNPLVPVATNDMLTAPQGATSSVNVLTNDDFLPRAGTSLTVISGGTATGTATFDPLTGILSYLPAPGESGLVTLKYRVCDTVPNPDVCAEATVSITISATNAKLNLKVLLQGALLPTSSSGGPIMTGIMRDDLRTTSPSQIPNLEPYTGLANSRFTQVGGGGETMDAGVLSAAGNDAIVDWVFVELRDKNNPATILKTRSALVQRDGDVVESTDGVSPLTFTGAVGESYYVSVKHRNHLGAMTAGAIAMTATGTLVDFTIMTAAQTYNLPGYDGFEQVDVNGKMALWAGNTNADKKVKYVGVDNDQIQVFGQAVNYVTNTTQQYNFDFATPVYLSADINMDAKVKYRGPNNDTSFIFFNVITKYALLNTGALYNYDLFIEQLP